MLEESEIERAGSGCSMRWREGLRNIFLIFFSLLFLSFSVCRKRSRNTNNAERTVICTSSSSTSSMPFAGLVVAETMALVPLPLPHSHPHPPWFLH